MNWLEVVIGLGLLAFGRRLFWVFIGAAGFAAGLWLIQAFSPDQPQHIVLAAGAVGAIAGIALAKFVKSVAVNAGGFLAGGVIGIGLARMHVPAVPEWLAFVVMGIIGILVMRATFDMALLLMSSIAGAVLVVQNLPLQDPLRVIVLIGLAVGGILIQRKGKKGDSPEKS
jgi:hypothetical protein